MNNFNTVAFECVTPINIWGLSGKRFMAVYRTRGCEYDDDGKGCTMCNFSYYADKNIKDKNILNQHEQIRNILETGNYAQFDLLTLGNFFNDHEISPELRKELLKPLSKIKALRRVLVESRYQYINDQKLTDAKKYLRDDQILEFAFGYESFSDHTRNKVLNKGVKEIHLDKTLSLCEKAGIDFVAYVLIKPHTHSEHEGIMEASDTALHILKKAKEYKLRARIAFEPMFVTTGKELERLFHKGNYSPPKLWSVIEVLNLTINKSGADFKKGSLFVGLSDEYLSNDRFSGNCENCTEKVRKAINEFNGLQNIDKLLKLKCTCKGDWEHLIERQKKSGKKKG